MSLDFLALLRANSSEAEVCDLVISPLLENLGYQESDWQKSNPFLLYKPTFSISTHRKDRKDNPPHLLVEVKKANPHRLNANDWNLTRQMKKTGAMLGMLTNGFFFQIFFNEGNGLISKILDYSQSNLNNSFDFLASILNRSTAESLAGKNLSYSDFLKAICPQIPKQSSAEIISSQAPPAPTQKRKENQKAKVITVFNNKGGVGKTTMTINLGAALNYLGNKVLLVDIDAQSNLTTGLGVDPFQDIELAGRYDICDLLLDPEISFDQNLIISKSWGKVNLDFIPSHIRLSEECESEILKQLNYDVLLKRKLAHCLDQYDYILIDPPPSFGLANRLSLMACDQILIPTQLAPYSIRALEYVIKRTVAVQEARGEELYVLGIAISMYFRQAQRVSLDSLRQIEALIEQVMSDLNTRRPSGNVAILSEDTWIPHFSVIAQASSDEKACPISAIRDEQAQAAFEGYLNLARYVESHQYANYL